jgi:hypothetical protein
VNGVSVPPDPNTLMNSISEFSRVSARPTNPYLMATELICRREHKDGFTVRRCSARRPPKNSNYSGWLPFSA